MRSLVSLVLLAACSGTTLPVELTTGEDNATRWDVTFDGDAFAIAWTTNADRLTDDRLWFARISRSGELVQEPTEIADLATAIGDLRLTATPTGYIIWCRAGGVGNAPVLATRLDPAGARVGAVEVLDAAGAGSGRRFFDVVSTSDGIVMLASVGGVIKLQRYSPTLQKESEIEVEPRAASQVDPSVVAVGVDLLAIWSEAEQIRSARVALDGATTSNGPMSATGNPQILPTAAADGTRVLVGWQNGTERRSVEFASAADGVITPRVIPIPDNRYHALEIAIALRADDGVVAWQSDANTALTQIKIAHVSVDNVLDDDIRELTDARSPFFDPRLAVAPDRFAIVYGGAVAGSQRLFADLVD